MLEKTNDTSVRFTNNRKVTTYIFLELKNDLHSEGKNADFVWIDTIENN